MVGGEVKGYCLDWEEVCVFLFLREWRVVVGFCGIYFGFYFFRDCFVGGIFVFIREGVFF